MRQSDILIFVTKNLEYFCDDGWTLYGVKDALNYTKNMCYQVGDIVIDQLLLFLEYLSKKYGLF